MVEDNVGDADSAVEYLSTADRGRIEVEAVRTLEDATRWLSSNSCDVAILDLHLPDAQGLTALAELRRILPRLPIIVLTGGLDEAICRGAAALRVDDVIAKAQLKTGQLMASVLRAAEHSRAWEQVQQLQKLFSASPDAIVVVDRAGRVKYVNAQALAFFERSESELTEDRLHFAAREGDTVELRVSRPSGERVGELRLVELDWAGAPGYVATIRDITQQRNLEMQLLMSDRLVTLGTLAAGVAHEVNNPLAALLTNVGLAQQRLKDSAQPDRDLLEQLRDVELAATRIRTIVRDLRAFSRTEADTKTMVDVRRTLDGVARMAAGEIQHSAQLEKDYGEVACVEVNESRLSQVFLNLLVNAAQAIAPGNVAGNSIRISTRMGFDGRVVIDIRDTGPGMSEETCRRLFTPFFTTKPVGSGTGLGLAICQRIVESLGGTILVESELGKGTCFSVRLPAAEIRPEAELGAGCCLPEPDSGGARGRVLVIDDNSIVLQSAGRVLRSEHDLTLLDRAPKAVELIERGERFDVILCDLMMPEMTGMEFNAWLERHDPRQAEKVIFLTGGAFTHEAQAFLDAQARQRFEKPFDLQDLRHLVQRSIRRT